ncbi:oxygenase MpaB family protein [Rhodococcus triatomae]
MSARTDSTTDTEQKVLADVSTNSTIPTSSESLAVKPFTREDELGTDRRWRRFGVPTAAGESTADDGSPDYGIFGPGSVVWEVMLHPATLVFLNAAQGLVQTGSYKPIAAGLRDHDTLSRKARKGTLTVSDLYDRLARNAGMHAPMWLGDSATATKMAKHLRAVHARVEGEVIDVARPELGGYAANSPRDAMWAALTELHPMLRVYEAFAFRDGGLPRRLSADQRDRFIEEASSYLRLVGAAEEEIPHSMADLAQLYARYADLFEPSTTYAVIPGTDDDYTHLIKRTLKQNFQRSHWRGMLLYLTQTAAFALPVAGALAPAARRSLGFGRLRSAAAIASAKAVLPAMWLLQQPHCERFVVRRMWGPDAMAMIDAARIAHRQVQHR